MTDLREEVQHHLQRMADELSLQARHLRAQRFLIQTLYAVLQGNSLQKSDGLNDPVKSMVVGFLGPHGLHPDPEVFDIVMNMLDGRQADIVPFTGADPSTSK